MSKPMTLFAIFVLSACHHGSKGPPPGTHAAVLKPECDLQNTIDAADGATVMFYLGASAESVRPGFAPSRCPSEGLCGPDSATPGDCALAPKSDISITAMRPDGLVGTVRRFEDKAAPGCPDGLNVWVPRAAFLRDDSFKLYADFFIAPHCDR